MEPGAHEGGRLVGPVGAAMPACRHLQSIRHAAHLKNPHSPIPVILKIAARYPKIRSMGQLFERRYCPNCGRMMEMALPPGGKGPRPLQCIQCDRPDPFSDDRATGWIHGELRPQTKQSTSRLT